MSKLPLQYNSYYHIYNRGNNRQNIFFEERNYRYFLKLYAKYITIVADTFAYCLLPNHFHFLVRIKTVEEQHQAQLISEPHKRPESLNPVQQFSNLFNAYAKAINKTYQRSGSLFERPFKRIPIASERYFIQLIIYIHHNPQKHRLIDDFQEWPYSSYRAILSRQSTRLKRDKVLEWFTGVADFEAAHKEAVDVRQIAPLVVEDLL